MKKIFGFFKDQFSYKPDFSDVYPLMEEDNKNSNTLNWTIAAVIGLVFILIFFAVFPFRKKQ